MAGWQGLSAWPEGGRQEVMRSGGVVKRFGGSPGVVRRSGGSPGCYFSYCPTEFCHIFHIYFSINLCFILLLKPIIFSILTCLLDDACSKFWSYFTYLHLYISLLNTPQYTLHWDLEVTDFLSIFLLPSLNSQKYVPLSNTYKRLLQNALSWDFT